MANLVELFDNIVQMQNLNGVPLAAGKLYVYALGRTRLMDTWSDVDGESLNPNPIILDDAGQAHVYVSDDFDYTLVVCDQYNNEIFSLDKYLYSKGSHSHADVAVAPSESIAVSSYHVGECTVYVPYLTGQLGKVYEGIDPIVVNNQVDKISANHVPLGVQDPLYFVQDDEEGCIIGLSSVPVPEGTMNESAFGYQDGQITSYNGSAFSAGLNYEAGSYVDIDGNTINVTGLQPAGNYQSAGDYVVHDELSSYATQDWVENQSYMKEYMESAFYPSTSNPSGYLTAHQDISNKLDTTAFSTVSGDFLTAVPSEYVTENTLQSGLSSKLDSTAFSTVSSTFLTAHQSLDGLMSASLLEQSGGLITGYNGTAFAGQGGGVTGDFELSAGSGISIVDYPLEQKTVISVTAQGGNPEVEQAVIDNSATWNDVTAKLDTTAAYTPEFAYHDTAISSIDNSGLYDTSAHARINTLAGRISDLSSNKLDTTAFSDVSGTFLTAHQDLSDYQTIAGMTAYQPVGSYLTADALDNVSGDWNEVSAKLDTTAFSDVSGSFLTAHQSLEGYLQDSDLELNSYNKISAISGLQIAAGGSVELDYDPDGNISGIEGSALSDSRAGTPLYVEAPLFTGQSGNSAYIGVSGYVWQSALLFHTDTPVTQTTYTLNDNCSNYDKLDVDFYDINNWRTVMECLIPSNLDASGTRGGYFSVVPASTATGANVWFKAFNWTAANTTWTCYCSEIAAQGGSTTQTVNANQPENPPKVVNIIGWKRVGV